ncbi:MAG: AarF/ABC1/UbiB kinase family protein [Deltaproteobacteria bacterium]|nr:MAG: AarF/ABC1/UbiB kinase family protein [Deltaproteobacteria bacterium]
MTALLIILGVLLAVGLAWRLVASRRNHAGISTSVSARTAQVSALATRTAARKATLRLRQLVSSRERKRKLEEAYHVQTSAEAAALMGSMKGVFMKLGQIVSFARESLPPQAREALAVLQKDAPPMAFALVREVVEAELGGTLSDHFASFDEEPIASASIGQVHRARLPSGEEVVLKVQYPGVDEAIRADLRFGDGLAALISSVHKNADGRAIVAELKERLEDELDYLREAENQQRFAAIWAGHPLIRIPKVYPELTRRRVLCQEYVEGLGFYDFLEVATDEEKRLAVHALNDFVFDSMHLHGVFNGDPHPGNYLFNADGGVTFLDFGCVKRFDQAFLDELHGLNGALVHGDHAAFERHVRALDIVLPGRPYDHDFLWGFFRYHGAPFIEDREFLFDAAFLEQAAEVMKPSNLRRLNLPPDLIFFNRITFGLNAIYERLGARENFHRLYWRYLDRNADHPPALATLGVALPERFLASRRWLAADA